MYKHMKNTTIQWLHGLLGRLPYALPGTHKGAISFLASSPDEC